MKPGAKVFWTVATAIGMTLGLAGTAPAQDQTAVQRYPVPKHGSLQLNVPKDWRVASQSMEDPAAAILRFRPASGEAFYVQVTTIWLDPQKSPKKTPEELKANVLSSAQKPLQQAVEKQARIDELQGAQVIGYHYSLTDRAPKAG